VWCEEFPTRVEAMEAERRIKGWSRAKKMALIRGDWQEISRLAKNKNGPSTMMETHCPPRQCWFQSSGRTILGAVDG
jgi:hypothetical protein